MLRHHAFHGRHVQVRSALRIVASWRPQLTPDLAEPDRSDDPPLEVVIQNASSRWIVGRRFPITSRVYFLLVDDLFTDVDQIEGERSAGSVVIVAMRFHSDPVVFSGDQAIGEHIVVEHLLGMINSAINISGFPPLMAESTTK